LKIQHLWNHQTRSFVAAIVNVFAFFQRRSKGVSRTSGDFQGTMVTSMVLDRSNVKLLIRSSPKLYSLLLLTFPIWQIIDIYILYIYRIYIYWYVLDMKWLLFWNVSILERRFRWKSSIRIVESL
jgi:hypothetical protein